MKKLLAFIMGALVVAFVTTQTLARTITVSIPEITYPATMPVVGDYSGIHTVAIVSLLESKLKLWNPRSIFGVKQSQLDIHDWALNEWNVRALEHHLSSRYAVKSAGGVDAIDPAVLARALNCDLQQRADVYRRYFASVSAEGADAFVVVRAMPSEFGSLMLQTPWMGEPRFFAWFFIEIVDAHDFHVIASAASRLQTAPGREPTAATTAVDSSYGVGSDFVISPEKREMLKTAFTRFERQSVMETLRVLELGIDLPPPGDPSIVQLPN